MNKVVVALAAVVAVLLLALPPALGTLTEARVRERVAAIERGGVVSAEVKSFDRGWFRSTAKIEFGLAPEYVAQAGAAGGPGDLLGRRATIRVDFAHGPLALQNGVHLGWSTMLARLDLETPGVAEIQQQLGVPYLFEFRGRTGFFGGVAFDADVAPMDVPAHDAQLKFSGARLDGIYAGNRLVASARIDSFEFTSPGGTVALRTLGMKTDSEILSQYRVLGNADFSLGSVSVVDARQGATPVFQADNLKIATVAKDAGAGALLDVQVTYGLDRLHFADDEFTGATLGLAFHNVDVEAVQHLRRTAREPTPDGASNSATAAADLQRVLEAGPTLTVDPIRFAFEGEPFEARAELATDPASLPAGGLEEFDVAAITGVMHGNADVKMSKPLTRRLVALVAEMQFRSPELPAEQLKYMAEGLAGIMLAQILNEGILVEDAEVYRATLRYADGELTLNGKPLPPFDLP